MNSVEAQKGFLTFIATLAISVGIFFATYLGVKSLNSKANNSAFEKTVSKAPITHNDVAKTSEKQNVFANLAQTTSKDTPVVLGKETASDEGYSMTTTKAVSTKPAVLAGATTGQSTAGATPTTGSESIAYLLMLGISTVFAGVYYGSSKARAYAIKNFEKKVSEEL